MIFQAVMVKLIGQHNFKQYFCLTFYFLLYKIILILERHDKDFAMTKVSSKTSSIDTALICFAVMAHYFDTPLSLEQIKQKYNRQNFEEYELLQLAKEFSFKAKFVETSWEEFEQIKLPVIAQAKNNKYFIVGKYNRQKVLILNPLYDNRPQILNKQEFADMWNGKLLILSCCRFINAKKRKFGISRFIPLIAKYRRLFGRVILTSFLLLWFIYYCWNK